MNQCRGVDEIGGMQAEWRKERLGGGLRVNGREIGKGGGGGGERERGGEWGEERGKNGERERKGGERKREREREAEAEMKGGGGGRRARERGGRGSGKFSPGAAENSVSVSSVPRPTCPTVAR